MEARSLEQRVMALEETVVGLQNLPNQFAEFHRDTSTRFGKIEARLERIDGRLDHIDGRLDQIDRRLDDHDSRFDRLEARITEEGDRLYARMRMLHEDLVERIKAISEGRK